LDGNGLDGNGLDGNGLDGNGLDGNGLDANGLDPNGLLPDGIHNGQWAADKFNKWFAVGVNPPCVAQGICPPHFATSDKIMKYVTKCAKPAGQSLTFTISNLAYTSDFCTPNPDGSTTCSYPGVLGLAPVWSSNQPIPLNEQRQISACLAAHLNASGETITVSFRGSGLLVNADEAFQYVAPEAVFWGNIFDGTGVFMQKSTATFGTGGFTPRGCIGTSCSPLITNTTYWATSQGIGTRFADGSFTSNATASPTMGGQQYPAIATFVDPAYAAAHAPSNKGVLVVQVSGLPQMNGANWANGQVYVQSVGTDFVSINKPGFHVATAGTYSVTAYSALVAGHTYTPSAPPTSVTVSAGAVSVLSVTYQY